MSERVAPRDRWLFLTPEIERDAPRLLAALAAAAEHSTCEQREVERVEWLIHNGSTRLWFAYLRDCRELVERAARNGGDPADCRLLALILLEQHLLAPGTRDPEAGNEDERGRLAKLAASLAEPA